MKKITLLMCSLLFQLGISQTPVVLEDFDGTAPTIGVSNGAGGTSATIVADPAGTNGNVLQFITDAAGVPWQQADLTLQDVYLDLTPSVATSFSVDVYSTTAFDVLAKVSGGINTTTGASVGDSAADAIHGGTGWETLVFDFSAGEIQDNQAAPSGAYNKVFFFNLWNANDSGTGAGGWTCDNTGNCASVTAYYDNITGVLGNPPNNDPATGPAAPPARDAADVMSFYGGDGNSYTDEAGVVIVGFGAGVPESVTLADGQVVTKVPGHKYHGIGNETQGFDVSAMDKFYFDFYTTDDMTNHPLGLKFEDLAGGQQELAIPAGGVLAADQWHSVEVDLSLFNSVDFSQLKWIVPVTWNVAAGITIYYDNVYFFRQAVDANTDASLSALEVDGVAVDGFNSSTLTYDISVATGTTAIPQITTATTTQAGASAVITQATAVPGSATVDVTAVDGTTTQTYTISYAFVGPGVAAPTPPARAEANHVSMYSNAYTNQTISGFTVYNALASVSDYTIPNTGGDICLASTPAAPGDAFAYEYFGNGLDLSNQDRLHVDLYLDEAAPVGAVWQAKLLQSPVGQAGENILTVDLGLITPGTWFQVDIPFSNGSNPALTVDNVEMVQIFAAGPVDGYTLYMDNIYFHNDTPLGVSEFDIANFKVFPNPSNDNWNISANTEITKVSVFDILGKEVITLTPNRNEATIEASSLGTGIYFAKIEGVKGNKTVKLIRR
ncbi:MAG: T9SS type A sorting domain-containing protein [Proteobacteria bacterium]|nr:T9SS type A sorting domain-containing protein [Pseudomonadota bacterium]